MKKHLLIGLFLCSMPFYSTAQEAPKNPETPVTPQEVLTSIGIGATTGTLSAFIDRYLPVINWYFTGQLREKVVESLGQGLNSKKMKDIAWASDWVTYLAIRAFTVHSLYVLAKQSDEEFENDTGFFADNNNWDDGQPVKIETGDEQPNEQPNEQPDEIETTEA